MSNKKEYPHPHSGHRKRLKTRFLRDGLTNFEEHEILELLLYYSIPRQDTNELAHSLIKRFDGLNQVLAADYRSLIESKGISEHSATLLKLVSALGEWRAKQTLKRDINTADPDEVGIYFADWFRDQHEEWLVGIFLDASGNKIGGIAELAQGSIQQVAIPTARIMEEIALRHAKSFILAHNHPDGSLEPSRADTESTEKLYQIFSAVGTPMREHYLIAGDSYRMLVTYLQDNLRLQ